MLLLLAELFEGDQARRGQSDASFGSPGLGGEEGESSGGVVLEAAADVEGAGGRFEVGQVRPSSSPRRSPALRATTGSGVCPAGPF